MKKLTICVKLINRVKPEGLEGYKKAWKKPRALRTEETDHLNEWRKPIKIMADHQANHYWGEEMRRIQDLIPWQMKRKPAFGDMLIGYVSDLEFGDFSIGLFVNVKKIKR
jgi:hypothetical protein